MYLRCIRVLVGVLIDSVAVIRGHECLSLLLRGERLWFLHPRLLFFAGFVRDFIGNAGVPNGLLLRASLAYDIASSSVVVNLATVGDTGLARFTVTDNAYGQGGPWTELMHPHSTKQVRIPVAVSGNWYDLSVVGTMSSGHSDSEARAQSSPASDAPPPLFLRRFAGRMETGRDTVSDPAMAAGVPSTILWPQQAQSSRSCDSKEHPLIPERFRSFQIRDGSHKDAVRYWTPNYKLKTEL